MEIVGEIVVKMAETQRTRAGKIIQEEIKMIILAARITGKGVMEQRHMGKVVVQQEDLVITEDVMEVEVSRHKFKTISDTITRSKSKVV